MFQRNHVNHHQLFIHFSYLYQKAPDMIKQTNISFQMGLLFFHLIMLYVYTERQKKVTPFECPYFTFFSLLELEIRQDLFLLKVHQM